MASESLILKYYRKALRLFHKLQLNQIMVAIVYEA